ncbi:hypothetical protein U3516DRAFT_906196 [Neocallimastix sp. 'constans']
MEEDHLNEHLPTTISESKSIKRGKSILKNGKGSRNGNINDNKSTSMESTHSNKNINFLSSLSISDSDLSMTIHDFPNAEEYQKYKAQKKLIMKKFSKKWKEVKNQLNLKDSKSIITMDTSTTGSFQPTATSIISSSSSSSLSLADTDTASEITKNNVVFLNDENSESQKTVQKNKKKKIKDDILNKSYHDQDTTSGSHIYSYQINSNKSIDNDVNNNNNNNNDNNNENSLAMQETIIITNATTTATTAPSTVSTTADSKMESIGTIISTNSNEPLSSSSSQIHSQSQSQSQLQSQSIYRGKDTINIIQTYKDDQPIINMHIKTEPSLKSTKETNDTNNTKTSSSEVYSRLTTQIKELSQESKNKDDKIQQLYQQLQKERTHSELLKSKFQKLQKAVSRTNEKNQHNIQQFMLKSDEYLYQTEKEYLKKIRELELELYKERLYNKSMNNASTYQINKLNEALELTTQEYKKNSSELNKKHNNQIEALHQEFNELKKKIETDKEKRDDTNIDLIFKVLNEKNTYANNYIKKLMNKIKK